MRGKQAKLHKINPDGKFNNLVVAQFINYVMQDGKKTIAEGLVYNAMDKLAETTKLGALEAFTKALDNVRPKIELRSRRVGGANYQVPVPVSEKRQLSLTMRWIIKAATDGRAGKDFSTSLYNQLFASYNKEGAAYKKKEDVHKMAEANKAFSHLTW
jgi:small subunit ribosomal protein S7